MDRIELIRRVGISIAAVRIGAGAVVNRCV